jgi:uncharacterized protein YbjQ (UPF0145 family)
MKFYSEGELREIVEELSEAAEQAIEQAAAEAAKASAIAAIQREAAAWTEAQHWQCEYQLAKKTGVKTAVITGVICFLGGFAIGAGGIMILQGVN